MSYSPTVIPLGCIGIISQQHSSYIQRKMTQIIPFLSLMVALVACLCITSFTYANMRESGDELPILVSLVISFSAGFVLGIMLHFAFCYIFPNGLQTTIYEITPFWEPIIYWLT